VCIARVVVGGGERGGKRRVRGGWRLLKRRQGRGGGPGFSAMWRGKTEEGPGFGDVDRYGTDAAAPGCSDSGGRRTPHGHDRRGL
jgi:hypothetical protein